MQTRRILMLALAGLLVGCGSTKVVQTSGSSSLFPKPARILIYNFAVSPDEVKLDRGISAELQQAAAGQPRTEQERAVGQKVAAALAAHLVKELETTGIPVDRATEAPLPGANVVTVQGQFVSVDQGNRTERLTIGLGLGRTDVRAVTQVYVQHNDGRTLVRSFEVDAKSGRKPGAAETLGVGAAAGTLATSAAITAGGSVVSETIGDTVEADASRAAKDIAQQLKTYFASQGWITAGL